MKKVLFCLCCGLLSISLVGCGSNSLKLGEKSNYEINNSTINMVIDKKSISNTGLKIFMENYTGENYEYGAGFSIEYQKKGIWYSIIPKEEMNFIMMAYLLENNTTKELNFNWEDSYGKLPSGKYRIVKSISKEKESVEIYISAEFIIE